MRALTKDEAQEIMSLTFEDLTMPKIKSLIGRTIKIPEPRFQVDDYFMLPENTCSKNLPGFTSVGLFIFNRLVTEREFTDITGYINSSVTGGTLKKLYTYVSQAYVAKKVTPEQFYFLIDMLEWIGGGDLAELLNTSLTTTLFTIPDSVKKVRDDLFKKYAKELAAGDTNVGSMVEKAIVDAARNALKGLPEWDNFASGAKLDFDNGYKTMMLVKGPMLDSRTNEWTFAKSNYNDGISKDEYAMFAGSAVTGTYSRALGVAQGGYSVKKFIASLQDIQASDENSDCGTKDTLDIYLDPYLKNEFLYMNIVGPNGKLINLTEDNIGQYVGKRIKLRSPMYCKHPAPKLCSKCIGDHAYKMNIKNIGLASTKIGSTLMNKRLLTRTFGLETVSRRICLIAGMAKVGMPVNTGGKPETSYRMFLR